jgi:hypothetical protein
MEKEKPILIE